MPTKVYREPVYIQIYADQGIQRTSLHTDLCRPRNTKNQSTYRSMPTKIYSEPINIPPYTVDNYYQTLGDIVHLDSSFVQMVGGRQAKLDQPVYHRDNVSLCIQRSTVNLSKQTIDSCGRYYLL